MSTAQVNNSKITVYVVSCWIFAAFGGLMFGYDIGISGLYTFLFLFNYLLRLSVDKIITSFYQNISDLICHNLFFIW